MESGTHRLVGILLLGSVWLVNAAEPGAPLTSEPMAKNYFTLLDPAPMLSLREINALYENPYTVDAGHAQVETFVFQYSRDQSSVQNSTTLREAWTFGPMTLKLGVLNNLDAEVVLSPVYTHISSQDKSTGEAAFLNGFGNTIPRLKLNLWGDDGGSTALAIVPFLKVPTHSPGLGNRSLEGGLILPFSVELPYGWWMVLSPEVDCARDVHAAGYHPGLANTVYFCHQIAGKLSGYADLLACVSTETPSNWMGVLDFGLSYALSRNMQVDLGLGVGVMCGADDLNPYLGYSFRF
jgi:hypothetical protein